MGFKGGKTLLTRDKQVPMVKQLQTYQMWLDCISGHLLPESFRGGNDEVRIWGITMTSRYFHRPGTIPMNSYKQKRAEDLEEHPAHVCHRSTVMEGQFMHTFKGVANAWKSTQVDCL